MRTNSLPSDSRTKNSLRKQRLQKTYDLHMSTFTNMHFNFCWRSTLGLNTFSETGRMLTMHSIPKSANVVVPSNSDKQVVNHFPYIKDLTTKTGLLKSLTSFCTANNLNVFDVTPLTYLVVANVGVGVHGEKSESSYPNSGTPSSLSNTSFPPVANSKDSVGAGWNAFKDRFTQYGTLQFEGSPMPEVHCHHNMWIIKPSGLNCGRGIQVFQEISAIKKFMQSVDGEYVVQKYIERPLLLWGRKFDMRIWVVVTDECNIYMYKNGYIRTSSEKFTLNLRGASTTDKQMVCIFHNDGLYRQFTNNPIFHSFR
jgi:hypothetical protein